MVKLELTCWSVAEWLTRVIDHITKDDQHDQHYYIRGDNDSQYQSKEDNNSQCQLRVDNNS